MIVFVGVVVILFFRYADDPGASSSKKKKLKKRRDHEEEEPQKKKKKMDKSLKKKMKKLIEVICIFELVVFINLQVVMAYEDSDGRVLSEPFWKLPSKKELPDYYEVCLCFLEVLFSSPTPFQIIRRPVDIAKIQQRIEDEKYEDMGKMQVVSGFVFGKSYFQYSIAGLHAVVRQHPEI